MERVLQDLRLAVRLLRKDRGFTATVIATLALCLGANIAIFAVVNSVLLKPLPFQEPERIVRMFNAYPGAGAERGSNGVPDYFDRRELRGVFDDVAVYRSRGVTVGRRGTADAERLDALQVTPSFFRLLRQPAARGQVFAEADAEPGQDAKVVLTWGTWQRLFGGRDDAIGQDLRVDGRPLRVVGVLPAGFRFVDPDIELFTVAAFDAAARADDQRHNNSWEMIGRLAPGVSEAQAQDRIDALNAENLERFPALKQILINAGFHTPLVNFQQDLVREVRPVLNLLWGGVLVVLLIGCVNIANLASVRATSRQRELVTRMALGAGSGRIAQQILTEATALSLAGGVAGLLLGWWGLRAMAVLGLDAIPRGTEAALDGTAFLYALGLVVFVGLAVGLLPVLALRGANLGQIMREEGRSGTPSRRARLVRRALVASQVAFALVLLVGAGVLVASFSRLLAVDPGFSPEGVLTGRVSLPASRYPDGAAVRPTLARMLERVRAIPGVVDAGLASSIPMGANFSDSVILAEGYQMSPGESLISPTRISISDGYPEALGMRLVAGRWFDARDTEDAPRTIIVDERLAEHFWPGQSPLGRRMFQPASATDMLTPPPDDQLYTVVGVAAPVRLRGLDGSAASGGGGTYYFPYRRNTERSVYLAVRAGQDPATLAEPIRRALADIDPELPFFDVMPMSDVISRSLNDRRTPMALAVSFGAVALFLSAIGLYGVLAYQVAQRRREIGIRMALGAGTAEIFGMVVLEGGLIVAIGGALGLAGAVLLRPALQAQLYEVGALDPNVVVLVVALLALVALAACLLPARRAARIDPVHAISE
ncbi:MAG: ABC transporter permease [Vicinamibacterales bacterium]